MYVFSDVIVRISLKVIFCVVTFYNTITFYDTMYTLASVCMLVYFSLFEKYFDMRIF